ncbi:hypothetical protein AYO39_02290 [Actinobacteria bacterium SCGC AG-212-D09]|nr:hypothetical protein AYO39_02290 [Actinobacteria bacterium SCGC AG-212-D09]
MVAVLVVVPGAGLLLSSVSSAAGQHEHAAGRGGQHVIRGGSGNNVLRGRAGNDVIFGGRGNDLIYAGPGNDLIYGGPGDDRIYGGPGNDRIYGGAGNDVIQGGRGTDRIYGGRGNDQITAELGATTVFPGPGTNSVNVADGRPNDRVVCAAGSVDHITADRGDRIARSCLGKGSTLSYGDSGLSGPWMHDLENQLWSRKLSDIVIPGSHDTGTYALPDDPISLIGKAQTEDITNQLNDGIRSLDIRVRWSEGAGTVAQPCYSADYYARHGALTACSLTMSDIFNQIATWTNLPGNQQEIILVSLSIDNSANGDYADVLGPDCEALGKALGSALLTPGELEAAGYSADPGQVTLGQLWAMPGHPRVLVTDELCMDLAAGAPTGNWPENPPTWNPDPPFGSGPGQSYYANQCYASPYTEYNWLGTQQFTMPGIESQVEGAAETRAIQGGGDDFYPGDPEQPGLPMQGGLWSLFLQATPTWACLKSLADFDPAAQKQVLADLYRDYWNDPSLQANINILAGDFVQDSDLVIDAGAIDESYPEVPGAIAAVGADQVKVPLSAGLVPAAAFAAQVTDYTGAALPGAQVTYQISGPAAYLGFGPKRAKTATVTSDAQGDINPGDSLRLDQLNGQTGTWTVTATGAGGTHAAWTLNVEPDTGVQLMALAAGDTVEVGKSYDIRWPCCVPEGAFAVHAKDAQGNLVAGVQVTFNLGSAGTFPNGSNTVTVPTSGAGFTGLPAAVAPAFTATTSAGKFSVSISAPGADNTLSLPFTVTPDPPVVFRETQGQGESAPINTKFPIALQGHWLDQYGNATPAPPGPVNLSLHPASGATWSNGQSTVDVTPDADGTITAPDLTAGSTVLNGSGLGNDLEVYVNNRWDAWDLQVTPGPPAKLAANSGGHQQTAPRKPFARALTAKVSDARGHPVSGAPVLFKVTSGAAAFAPLDLRLVAGAVIGVAQQLLKNANTARNAVTEPTNAQGVATAPALTAGPKAGPITVTASVGTSGKVKVVFHPSVVRRRRH